MAAYGQEPAVVGDAVDDAAHRVLADAEAEVAPGVIRLEVVVPVRLDVGEVGFGQVGRAAEQLGQRGGEQLDRVLARVAGRNLGPVVPDREARVPAVGQPPRDPPLELGRVAGIGLGECRQLRLPVGDPGLALIDRPAEQVASLVRDVERLVRVPAVRLLGEANLVRPERRPVRLLRCRPCSESRSR